MRGDGVVINQDNVKKVFQALMELQQLNESNQSVIIKYLSNQEEDDKLLKQLSEEQYINPSWQKTNMLDNVLDNNEEIIIRVFKIWHAIFGLKAQSMIFGSKYSKYFENCFPTPIKITLLSEHILNSGSSYMYIDELTKYQPKELIESLQYLNKDAFNQILVCSIYINSGEPEDLEHYDETLNFIKLCLKELAYYAVGVKAASSGAQKEKPKNSILEAFNKKHWHKKFNSNIENFNIDNDCVNDSALELFKNLTVYRQLNEAFLILLLDKDVWLDKFIFMMMVAKGAMRINSSGNWVQRKIKPLMELLFRSKEHGAEILININGAPKLLKSPSISSEDAKRYSEILMRNIKKIKKYILDNEDIKNQFQQDFIMGEIEDLKNYEKQPMSNQNYKMQLVNYLEIIPKDKEFSERLSVLKYMDRKSSYFYDHDEIFLSYIRKYHYPIAVGFPRICELLEYDQQSLIKADLDKSRKAIVYMAEYLADHPTLVLELFSKYQDQSVGLRYILVKIIGMSGETYRAQFQQLQESSKQVTQLIVQIYAENREWQDDIKLLLSDKVLARRKMALEILKIIGVAEFRETLSELLETEKNQGVKDQINIMLGGGDAVVTSSEVTGRLLVDNMAKPVNLRRIAWLLTTPLPLVHDDNGEVVEDKYMQACLLYYNSMNPLGISQQVKQLTESLNKQDLESFVAEVYYRWYGLGAETKQKWVLYFCSLCGGMNMVNVFVTQIKDWAENSRGAIAAEATKALALNPSSVALMTVDSMSRKYKFKQVKKAALEAMESAAKELNITKEELSDKIVPDMGFGEQMEKVFDYGTRTFKAYLNLALELEVFDEKNKKIKSLPAVGKSDNQELAQKSLAEYKDLKKQLKLTAKVQKERLDLALSDGRKWEEEKFFNLFVKNPIMHQFAMTLIWGVYKDGELQSTFRYMEDGTFNTADEDEFIPEDDMIFGIVHRIELAEDDLKTWKEQLEDYEVIQSLNQLDRNVFVPTEEELNGNQIERFGGKMIYPASLVDKLMSAGWNRGAVMDAGSFDSMHKEIPLLNIGVEIHFSDCSVGYYDDDAVIYDVVFYRLDIASSSYGDRADKNNIVPLNKIPLKLFSETVYQLDVVLGSCKNSDDDWKKESKDRIGT